MNGIDAVEGLTGLSPAELARERIGACEGFLATRSTSMARINEVVGRQMDELRHLLLTSSPVHGLANATSDIDTICIVGTRSLGARTATQIFDHGNHYETIPFTEAEVEGELLRLQGLDPAPAALMRASDAWDRGGPIKRKYLERIVNGVSVEGTLPYLDALPALARLWSAAATARFMQAAGCAVLAGRAGEGRAAVGYALNAVLHAMDATLSTRGHVYSNKKWFLLRWRRFRARGLPPPAQEAWGRSLEAGWTEASAAMAGTGGTDAVVDRLTRLMAEAEAALGPLPPASWRLLDQATAGDFLAGARLHLAAGSFLAAAKAEVTSPLPLAGLAMLDAGTARLAWQLVRAGQLAFRPGEETA